MLFHCPFPFTPHRLPSLRELRLWNVVVTDSDLAEVLSENPLPLLEEVRVGSGEIGFVRLTEDSARVLARTCPRLRALGGVCEWSVRDLLPLLCDLLESGGWVIGLEK